MGQQIARRLYDTIMKSSPDLVIDIHNDWIRSVPYVLVDPTEIYTRRKLEKRVLRLAGAAGLLLVEDSDVFHPLRTTLAGAMINAGVAAFTIESGGAYSVVEEGVGAGTRAVLSTLKALDMVDWYEPARQERAATPSLRYTNMPRCTTSGLIRFVVSPGDPIRRGQLLAEVFSAFGSREESLHAAGDGFVLGLEDYGRVLPGREVIAIAESPGS
jgi:uncharacterized protein